MRLPAQTRGSRRPRDPGRVMWMCYPACGLSPCLCCFRLPARRVSNGTGLCWDNLFVFTLSCKINYSIIIIVIIISLLVGL